ncbi:aspartate--tRNA ligase 2, cytoplasmic-like isoform X2 [Lolium rigidum]|uniref:aspartate--tRNA ligase 2, cytoplasmic-like isoform X2 n=1 Tax=Lolium rigidum TaxID=89674 RepID=UPI001F5C8F63|nr:aspartate--tRNA ligase 2, cytoplasmic-like isoform X2 [Lolium rigidum]
MSTEQQAAVTKKHSGSSKGRRAKSKKKIAQDPYDSVYGRIPWDLFRERPWMYAGKLDESRVGNYVLLLGSVMQVRPLGKTRTIVVLLSNSRTVRCKVVASADKGVTTRMVHFAATLRKGTYLDVEGVVSPPGMDKDLLPGTTQPVEIQVRKLHTIATNKDGSPLDGVTTDEEDDSVVDDDDTAVDGVVATIEDSSPVHGVNIDGVTTMEDISQVGTATTAEDGSLVHGLATMEDGSLVDSVTMMDDDSQVGGASQSSSISIPTRPSIMLPENPVGREGESQVRNLHTIGKYGSPVDAAAAMEECNPVDELSQTSSIGITARQIMLPENLVGRKGAIQVRKVHTISTTQDGSTIDGASKSSSISITTRPSIALEENLAGWGLAHADERPSLNYDYANPLPVCHAIFRIHSEVEYKIMEFLRSKHFVGIHTHGIFAGSVEGGLAVVNPEDITGQRTFLAQSPLLYKQMATCEVKRVFEIGPLFRHEKSNCKLHICDLAAEMEIKDHYLEVCDIVNALLVDLFKHLNENCKKELEAISQRYPAEPPKYLEETLMLKYDEGIQMLKEAGTEVKHMTDLTGKHQQELCQLVREKYGTDLFILHQHPSAVCPLYTMPCVGNPAYSNSFDVFFRGEQVISGSQRIHERGFFVMRAAEYGIDIDHVLDNFRFWRYGVPPHGGFRACLSRVVMLFCGLDHF